VPLFVLILIAAVLWRQRHRPTAKRLAATLDNGAAQSIPAVHALSGIWKRYLGSGNVSVGRAVDS
jgi:hypothetical protein